MSIRERFSRKSLKKPDEFLSLAGRLIHYFEANRNVALVSIFAIAILVVSLSGVRYKNFKQVSKMESLLFEMKQHLEKDKGNKPEQVIKELELQLDKFSEGSQKQRARLLIADFHFQNSHFDKALNLYTEIVSRSSPGDLSHDLAELGRVYSFEAKKEYAKAIAGYKVIIDQKTFALPLFPVYMNLSRNYELSNDKKNALLLLREMINKFQAVKDLDKINQQIVRLEAKP